MLLSPAGLQGNDADLAFRVLNDRVDDPSNGTAWEEDQERCCDDGMALPERVIEERGDGGAEWLVAGSLRNPRVPAGRPE